MVAVRYGGKGGRSYSLGVSEARVAVRTREARSVAAAMPSETAPVGDRSRDLLQFFEVEWRIPTAGVELLNAPGGTIGLRDATRDALSREAAVRFAGRVLEDPVSGAPVVYTENFFVKFHPDLDEEECRRILADHTLRVKRPVTYSANGYFAAAPEGTGITVFDIAEKLLALPQVELCHPELVRESRARRAFEEQWHLQKTTIRGRVIDASANVVAAWALSQGEGTTIAVIDDGMDLQHEEFRSAGKIVAPRDATRGNDNPSPRSGDNHGTACAGVACADGNFGASGVAPRARLMPIRLASVLGSQAEADAFQWAADHGADVISCSWGPADGDWRFPNDPQHQEVVPLPDSTREAIDYAIANGRNGKGCVITWAAGNGNESVDNDGYASYPKVIAVAACNDMGTKSAYSDFGQAVWCTFPSNHGAPAQTPGIWTTDRSGASGYNDGDTNKGDENGNYTNSFGGTSSACPGVAGTAALILARNPALRWDQVREIFRTTADPIDAANGDYDAVTKHSPKYGYGRVNARNAVLAATVTLAPQAAVVRTVRPMLPIRDNSTVNAVLSVSEGGSLAAIKATVDIEHTWVGDLTVSLQPPPSLGVGPIMLHARGGGSVDNLRRTYDVVSTPELQNLIGKAGSGEWTLTVADEAAQDEGVLHAFSLELGF
ncbi:MAG TPA: S8 family serine peptidase [Thermoanaerobaculia bacterium]